MGLVELVVGDGLRVGGIELGALVEVVLDRGLSDHVGQRTVEKGVCLGRVGFREKRGFSRGRVSSLLEAFVGRSIR